MQILILYLLVANAISFVIYGVDKQKAKHNRWRVPEKVLLGLAVLGGSVGAYAGMYTFRHKTQKAKFCIGVPLIFLLQIVTIIYFKVH